jgi:ribonuclease III
MELFINEKALGTGIGKNKKEAAQNAAKEAIERLHKGESVPPSPE